jgi:nucleoside-diphosphate-sugar epimerase
LAHTVVVTAATGPLGQRVCARAAADPTVDRVVAIDQPGGPEGPTASAPVASAGAATIEHHRVALDDPEMKRLCEGATAVVHLVAEQPALAGSRATGPGGADGHGEVEATRALLATCATSAGVSTLVVLSSAMVYGAWPGNPVPLTEAAPLRPVPALRFAVERAEVERLAAGWRDERAAHLAGREPSSQPVTVAVLRPAVSVGSGPPRRLGRSPWAARGLTVEDEPPSQFVHLDDIAAAIDLARRARLDGPFNVAPDGWLSAEARRGLGGPAPRLALPGAVAERLAALRWRAGLTRVPPGLLPYTMYPWVVANDRLKAAGWVPTHTNEEAFVAGDAGSPLDRVQPRRRQILSLALLAAPALAVVAGALVAVRRWRRSR